MKRDENGCSAIAPSSGASAVFAEGASTASGAGSTTEAAVPTTTTITYAYTTTVYATASASATPISTASSSGNSTEEASELVSAAWYPDWLENFTPANISWDKYTMVTYSFGMTTPDTSVIELSNNTKLTEFVQVAHENNVTALISLGGWSGSRYFSSAVATPENRTLFAQTVMDLVTEYELDGVDFDWEYPASNESQIGCNLFDSNDTANFLLFLQELRQADCADDLILTAAVGSKPWLDATGSPSTNVSDFAEVLDHISIMAYDFAGSWSKTVGANAPLNASCADSSDASSAMSSVELWNEAGFPLNQIVLGVASYGHSFSVASNTTLPESGEITTFPAFSGTPKGDRLDSGAFTDVCGTTTETSGVFNFWGLIEEGYLTENGTVADGVQYTYDECTQTPFVYNETAGIMVSYDDATSFSAKGSYIASTGLGGFAMWQVSGDYNDILLEAIRSGMGAN
ncbi:glycoside hydrolase family 18 protein [Cylindrobasidium torrendii FP15055 ss-10]|uniref:Glycoside hydrolase family 18 protein n=1 Tax=Cylindrobasidium torrendii FP15055 ss-10 TaxID=1314674 RepID=A0A0D7BLF2_9AGAR|nr:glycoside hydrolase family 18 protein [Cylindrobasidium torrendii FP15055 ss-10]